MNNLRPSLKIIFAFIISSIASYLLINFIISQVRHREELAHQEAANIIQQEISERFNLLLDSTLVIGQVTSTFFFNQGQKDKTFEGIILKILEEKEYILGLNPMDEKGKVSGVFPKERNQNALGKVSQNYGELLKSYKRGEKYWFSSPFELFQGGIGFAFYIPIKKNEKLIGWLAPVIRSQPFFENFRTLDFFRKYDLIVKDQLTGNIYFETSLPSEAGKIETKSKIQGRDIIFQSWPKVGPPGFRLSFFWRFLFSVTFGSFCGFIMKIYLQKKKAYSRLENISDLLKLTSNEALTKLLDIQTEYLKQGATGFLSAEVVEKDVQSVTNLIEQLELLQNMAISEHVDEENFEVLPLITENCELLREIISKKNLHLSVDSESFKGIKITGNKWLISNTVIKNALSYSALIACPSARIEISHAISPRECVTTYHIDKVYEEEVYKAFRVDRRLLVARNVMDLLNGNILIYKDGSGGMILKLSMSLIS